MKLHDARVLLTGASGGIGGAAAQALRAAGAEVMGVGRSAAPALPSGTAWLQADLASDAGIERVAAAASAWRANLLVHAAGLAAFGSLPALAGAQIDEVLRGSVVGRIGLPGFSVYGASKAGLHGFAEALRRELADTSVQVQILGPRSTRTALNGAAVERYNQATGTAMDAPEEVAAALLRLIDSEAAERFLGFPERFAVRLNGLLGAGLDGAFVRHRRSLPPADATARAVAPLRIASQGDPT